VSQRAGRDGLLVTAGELAAELAQDRPGDPGDPAEPPVLLDVRWRLAGAGLPVSTDEPAPAPGDFTAEPGQMPVLDAAGAPRRQAT
jgi:hypothetical protein